MRFCRNCGKELGEGDVFCPQCGSNTDAVPKRPRPVRWIAVFVVVAILILAVAAAPLLFREQNSYRMTFTVNWYTVTDADGTVDNDYDDDAEVYFQVSYGGDMRFLLIDTEDPLGYYSTRSAPVHTDVLTAKLNKIFPTEYTTAIFYVPVGETTVSITIFMCDYDGPAIFSNGSGDDILDLYDDGSPSGGSSSQGIKINIPVGEDHTDDSGGDADPRGFFGYSVSFEAI